MNVFFVPMSTTGAIFTVLMQLGLTSVIFIRTNKLYQNNKKHWFRYYNMGMTGLLTIGGIGSLVVIPILFRVGFEYPLAPLYRMYVIFAGIMLNMLIAFHMTIAAFSFLFMIYSTRGFTVKQFLVDWILHQDGFRYGIILAINSFSIYCYFYNATRTQNNITIQMFYVTHWATFAGLYTFMENSYSTAKAVMSSGKPGGTQSSQVTSGHGASQAQAPSAQTSPARASTGKR